jgi:hypothetical protein
MRNAFAFSNGRETLKKISGLVAQIEFRFLLTTQFVQRIQDRVQDRILHLLQYRSMQNVVDAIDPNKAGKVYGIDDSVRVNRVVKFIKSAKQPFFVQLHLMDSHCCKYYPAMRQFSAQHDKQTKNNVIDYYDDAILTADRYFGKILATLEKTAKLENTIVIYTSDHNRIWQTTESVPLVIRFPNGIPSGNNYRPSQLLDIAPTIVDYLGLSPQQWMEGESLISTESPGNRTIITTGAVAKKNFKTPTDILSQLIGSGPPLYGLRTMAVIDCDKYFELDVQNGAIEEAIFVVVGDRCSGSLGPVEARQVLKKHLVKRDIQLSW